MVNSQPTPTLVALGENVEPLFLRKKEAHAATYPQVRSFQKHGETFLKENYPSVTLTRVFFHPLG
jgi:hypothetical protein